MDVEQHIRDAWATSNQKNPEPTVAFFEHLLSEDPTDAKRLFELANAYDWSSREQEAIPLYERALGAGLDEDRDRRARVQYGSSLRNVGRYAESVTVLESALHRHPDSAAIHCFLALALADSGKPRAAVATAICAALTSPRSDIAEYREALARYVKDLC